MRSGCKPSSPAVAQLAFAGVIALVLSFSGCGSGSGVNSMVHGVPLQGTVHGGQQGVFGSVIQLYEVGATGYGSTALPLIAATTTTNAGGFFSITGQYTCPSPTTQVYIVATGGDPGVGTSNPALVMMAGLGNCGDLTSSTFIYIDEVTTAASVYALAPFMTGGATAVGSSSTNALGIANAFTTIKSLVNTANGTAPGTLPAGATAPTSEINTLADIIAPCVNSNGIDGTCSGLFAVAHTVGLVPAAPTNTLDTLLSIAQNPGYNASLLFNQATGTPPFTPVLATAPNDWTLPITYTGGGLSTPFFVAIDSAGGVWTTNNGNSSISKFDNFGNAISGIFGFTGGGLNNPRGIAIDGSGNAWVSDYNNPGAMSELDNNGNPLSGSGFTGGGLHNPNSVAVDGSGNIWTVSFFANPPILNNDLSEFNSSGTALSGASGFTGASLNNSISLAIAPVSGTVWAPNESGNSLSEFTNAGAPVTNIPGTLTNGIQSPLSIAIDASGNIWVADQSGDISVFDSTGAFVGLYGAGLMSVNPYTIAIDGVGNVWVPDLGNNNLFEMSPSGAILSPTGGFTAGTTFSSPFGTGIDASGNLWVANLGNSTITKIVGLAAPVTTPLATAVANNTLGTRP